MTKISTKQVLVNNFGGKCQLCGYNKSLRGLSFHHIDPSEKEFNISKFSKKKDYTFELLKELSKVVLVCENCHREIHEGKISTAELENLERFDLYDALNY